MEKWAEEYFSSIKNIDLEVPSYNTVPFDESRLAKLVKYVPVNDEDSIQIKWLIEHLHPYYKVLELIFNYSRIIQGTIFRIS